MNIRGFKSNHNYLHKLLDDLDVCAVSEHWLHSFNMHLLNKHHVDYNVYASPQSHIADEIDSVRLIPRYIRGNGGVAIFWRKSIDHLVSKLSQFNNNRVAAIKLSTREYSQFFCLLSAI